MFNKRLVTHRECGNVVLIADNFHYCRVCKVPFYTRRIKRKLPAMPRVRKLKVSKLRVPRALRRDTAAVVLPKVRPHKVPKLNVPRILKRKTSDIVLPKVSRRKLKVMTAELVDKPVVQPQKVSQYQREILALWQAR